MRLATDGITLLGRGRLQCVDEPGGIKITAGTALPFNFERIAALHGSPSMIRDNGDTAGDAAVNRQDMPDSGDLQGFSGIEAEEPSTEVGAPLDDRCKHSGNPGVEAVHGFAGDDVSAIDTLQSLADVAEVFGLFQGGLLRNGLSGGEFDEISVAGFASRGRVHDVTGLGPACRGVDAPTAGRRRDEHNARGGAGAAQHNKPN